MCVLYSSLSSLHIHAHLQSSVKRPRKKMKIGCVTLSQQPIFDRKHTNFLLTKSHNFFIMQNSNWLVLQCIKGTSFQQLLNIYVNFELCKDYEIYLLSMSQLN